VICSSAAWSHLAIGEDDRRKIGRLKAERLRLG
jgi:hypothetical protein